MENKYIFYSDDSKKDSKRSLILDKNTYAFTQEFLQYLDDHLKHYELQKSGDAWDRWRAYSDCKDSFISLLNKFF